MKYTIIIDKQPSTSPSEEKKEYTIDIEELRTYQGVSDTLKVTPDMAYVIRRLSLSEYGVLSILDEPKQENIKDLNIELFEGTNYVYILNEQGNKISASYIIKSGFTDTYPTKSEMNSAITQSASSIEISVNQKLEGYSTTEEMNSAIKVSADNITSTVSKTYETKENAQSQYSQIKQTTDGITSTVSKKVGKTEIISSINQSAESITINANKLNINGTISANGNFKVDTSGNMICNNATINGGNINLLGGNNENDAKFYVRQSAGSNIYTAITPKNIYIHGDGSDNARLYLSSGGSSKVYMYSTQNAGYLRVSSSNSDNFIELNGVSERVDILGTINAKGFNNTSLESIKKNIAHYNKDALEIILNSNIYSYNLKTEKNTDKKHIGFVIGDNYKTPKEVMNNEGTAIELYSAIGILWKGMQEQQKKIEELENKLKEVTNE